MRGVMTEVPQSLLEWRRRTGADRFDEMWEGVLHMAPAPNIGHQDFEGQLEAWFRFHWVDASGGRVYHNVNVSDRDDWRDNFRIPDLVLVLPDQIKILRDTHILGPPAVVVEIRSPGDETYEKLPFYARLGVPEVWVIDRDSKAPERHLLAGGGYELAVAAEDGWHGSRAVGVEFRPAEGAKFGIRLAADATSYRELPDP